jgi:hypothetical protein
MVLTLNSRRSIYLQFFNKHRSQLHHSFLICTTSLLPNTFGGHIGVPAAWGGADVGCDVQLAGKLKFYGRRDTTSKDAVQLFFRVTDAVQNVSPIGASDIACSLAQQLCHGMHLQTSSDHRPFSRTVQKNNSRVLQQNVQESYLFDKQALCTTSVETPSPLTA